MLQKWVNLFSDMKPCRSCQHEVAVDAVACPHCGAPHPAQAQWDGYGFEYKSNAEFLGMPLLHISFKYRANRMPVPARGVIAIGQFGCGVFCLAQFGVGICCLSQFTLACFAVAQFAIAYQLIAQIGVYVDQGVGQIVVSFVELFQMLM